MASAQDTTSTTSGVLDYLPRFLREHGRAAFAAGFVDVEGTLVSSDLSGFTKLSERLARVGREGAEELTEVLNHCFDRMIAVVEHDGGDILKFGGDALLILYTGEGHTARACRSTLSMRSLIADPVVAPSGARVKLRISQGIHAGRFGLFLSRGGHTELIVTGPGTTETVRCEGEAAPGEILLSAGAAGKVDPTWLGREKCGGRLLRRVAMTDDAIIDIRQISADLDWLDTFVPAAQREQIAIGTPSEHRRVSVAFVKFSSTDLVYESEGPAAVAQQLARLGEVVGAATLRHGVHWLASDVYPDGGKLILSAGAPTSFGRDEERMLRAVRDILDADLDLDLRAGVHCGPVFVGNLGSSGRRTFTVMGDAVNLAARLMQKANTGELVASDAVLERPRVRFATAPLEPFHVKGKAKPIDAALVGPIELVETIAVPSRLPLVGRDAELARLRAVVADARAGQRRVIEIVGGSGTGKSRLVEELRDLEGDARAVSATCGQYAQSTPYFAMRVLLRGLAGMDPMAPADEAGVALTRWVGDVAPDLARWIPLLAVPFDVEVPSTPEADLIAPEFRRARTHDVVASILDAVCQRLTLFVIEDAHYLDDASRELLAELAAHPVGRPMAFIVTRHPQVDVFDDTDATRPARLDLEPLDRDAALELAVLAVGDDSKLRPGEWEVVTDRAGGNPLFVIELAARAAIQGSVAELPDSVESLVTTRIDTLSAEDRMVLREAAVLGMVVDLKLFAAALATPTVGPERLHRLDEFLELLSPGVLRFRNRLHQYVAYEGLPYRRRRDAHRRVGDALVALAGGNPERDAELLSTHYYFAGAYDVAWRFSVVAGDRAQLKFANVEAIEFYRRALDCAPRVDDIRSSEVARVAEALGDVCELSARYDDAALHYRRARKHVADTRDDSVRLLRKEGTVRERTGRYRDALRWYSRGLRMLDSANDPQAASLRAQLSLAYAAVRHRQGRYHDSVSWAERAVDDARLSGDSASLARAYFILDIGYTYLGDQLRFEYRGRAVPIYEELGDDEGLSIVLNNLGLEAYVECKWSDALQYYARSREACDRIGDVVGSATAVNNEAEILLDQGHVEDATALFRDALRVCRSARYPIGVAIAAANLGLAEVRGGKVDAGFELLAEAKGLVDDLQAGEYVIRIHAQAMAAFVYAGLLEEASACAGDLRRALEANVGDEATTVMTERVLAWFLTRIGRHDEAAAFIEDGLRRGEAIDARYEIGLLRHARSELLRAQGRVLDAAEEAGRAAEILASLDVVSLPG